MGLVMIGKLRKSARYICPRDLAPQSALGLNWTPSRGDGDEEEPVQRRTDNCDPEAASGGDVSFNLRRSLQVLYLCRVGVGEQHFERRCSVGEREGDPRRVTF